MNSPPSLAQGRVREAARYISELDVCSLVKRRVHIWLDLVAISQGIGHIK